MAITYFLADINNRNLLTAPIIDPIGFTRLILLSINYLPDIRAIQNGQSHRR